MFAHAADRIQQETRERWQLDIRDVTALAYADNVTEQDQLTHQPAASADQQLTPEPAQISVNDSPPVNVSPDPALDERYDTPEHRDRLRARMETANVPDDAIQTRLLADIAQGRPSLTPFNSPPTSAMTKRTALPNPRSTPTAHALSAGLATIRFSFARSEPQSDSRIGMALTATERKPGPNVADSCFGAIVSTESART